jgi:tRNA threonylcarbamoyladenosine biosynthesis protein TsaB
LFAVDASGVWQRLQADAIVPFQMQLEQWIKKSEQPDIIVIAGEVEESLRPVIDAVTLAPQVSSSEDISRLIRQPVMVSARDIAAVARRHGSALRVQDVHELLPNYTQLAEAEAKWLAGQRAHE